MADENHVQQLGQVLQAQGYHVEPYVAHDLARAVLASGLVVPTSDVLNLAQQWDDAVPDLTATRGPDRGRTLSACAAELRALTQQEPR